MNADLGSLLSLEGRTALVSGAGGAIGRAVATLLASAGARVLGVDLPGCEPPMGVEFVPCDLGSPTELGALAARLSDEPIDVLVHCAGITRDSVLWKLSPEDWDQVLGVNLDSAFHLLRTVVPSMRAQGRGSVVLVASINGERGKFGQSNYAASKAGVIALAKTAARELGAFGVRVNAVAPGWIETAMTASLPDAARQKAIEETALGHLGQPDDVARSILFLCSDLSSHVTGQVLRVDGGQCTV